MLDALVQFLLWLTPVGLQLFWAFRLWRAGLVPRYRALFTYLVAGSALIISSHLVYVSVGAGSGYQSFWIASRPLVWVLFFVVVYECYSRMVEGYGAIKRVGQLVLYGALASVAFVVSYLLIANPYLATEHRELQRMLLVQEQSVYLCVAACIFAMLLFQRFFSLQLRKNVRVVFATFGLYFAGTAALLVLRSVLGSDFAFALNTGVFSLQLICMAVGAFRFTAAGEDAAPDPRLESAEAYTETLRFASERLKSVNMQLTRTLAK